MELPPPLRDHQPAVEQELRAFVEESAASGIPLYRMMQYQMGWMESDGSPTPAAPPPRLYGALCHEAAQAIGDAGATGPAAVASELFYNSVAVHEAMQVGEPHIETRPAVWWVWGPAQAINVGDGLHAMARLGIFRLQSAGLSPEVTLRAAGALDATALRFYEGQFLELTYQERLDVLEPQYLKMAEAKYGSLVGGAMTIGAHAAGASEATAEAFRRCGELLGVAAQIRQDEEAMWDESGPGGAAARVLNKSKLLPVVHALEKGTLAQKRALGEAYFKRVMEAEDVRNVRRVLDEVGAREYTRAKAEQVMQEALDALGPAGLSAEAAERWLAIAAYLAGR